MRIILISPNRLLHQQWNKAFLNSIELESLFTEEEINDFIFTNEDILVLDYDNFNEVLEKILQYKIICLSSRLDNILGFSLLKKGVKAYGNNYMTPINLYEVIKVVNSNKIWVYPELMSFIIENSTLNNNFKNQSKDIQFEQLTSREIDVAIEVSKGLTNKKIADILEISERTVKAHISAIFSKLDINDRVSLAIKTKEWLK